MDVDTTAWTGEGAFTPVLIEALQTIDAIDRIRVEDAPSSRAEDGYALIANEIFVTFRVDVRRVPVRRLGILPGFRSVASRAMTVPQLAQALAALEPAGPPDYADEGMLQYLRTERLVAPYQTRGIKVVEMVRIYEAGARRPD